VQGWCAILGADNFQLVHERINIMTHVITSDCISCGACEAECPEGAISAGESQYVIDPAKCQDCGACVDVCPTGACQPA